jgi:hypothetical protein
MKGIFCTREVSEGIDGKAHSVLSMLNSALSGCSVYCLDQVHSDRIVLAQDLSLGDIPEADAVISRNPDDVLCVRTADCVPVLAWSEEARLIAAIHAGWRGLALQIVEKTIRAMKAMGGRDIHASIGPAIGRCCYEVKTDVIDALGVEPETDGEGSLFVDLPKVAASQLEKAGLKPHAIDMKALCTSCNKDRFFSFRRQGDKAGRNISAIGGKSWSLPGLQVG